MTGMILGVLAVALLLWSAWTYNRFVRLDKRAEQAWGDIDAQLKRRHDLVPSLVETVKGYASHERRTLEEVVARRSVAAARRGSAPDTRAEGENQLVFALRHLFALAEDYPELRASDRFGELQGQLAEIEDALQNARRYYNAVVRDLNAAVAQFPALLVAQLFGFHGREYFSVDSPLERRAVEVELDA